MRMLIVPAKKRAGLLKVEVPADGIVAATKKWDFGTSRKQLADEGTTLDGGCGRWAARSSDARGSGRLGGPGASRDQQLRVDAGKRRCPISKSATSRSSTTRRRAASPGVDGVELRHRAVRIPLHRRALGLRQVDAAQHHRGLPHADRRRDPHRRQAGQRPRAGPRRRVPGFRAAVSLAHRARQRHLRAGNEGRAARPSARRSRASSSRWSSWRSSRSPTRITCRAGCSSGSRSRARWPIIPRCC